ncbi:MAG: hypothetical protein ACLP05_12765 [Candidatus Kryptoniota bacterium]
MTIDNEPVRESREQANKFRSLMKLMDDDDPQVSAAVERELLDGGDEIVRLLEGEKEIAELKVKKRIENLISRIYIDKLRKDYDLLLDFVSRVAIWRRPS